MRWKHWIDSHKGATPFFVILMMLIYRRWENPTVWVYLALHGSYGLLWVLKSRIFPDRQWEAPASLWRGLYIWGGLTLYWIAPFLICYSDLRAPGWLLGLAVAAYGIGVFLHFAADMQKHVALRLEPGRLITDGFFARVRNPNYLGEFFIYAAFASLAMSWIPFVVIALFMAIIWIPNMIKKDRSLARYPEFEGYKKKSRLFLPYIL